eukprot:TRINITY_DN17247_c0_g1_i2.p1 TRINITY_DN17247_c0_g1~~TRINITY_DN17247_c0_g1_i2.p1  ORF type:complete len:176 (-),score=20.27 TRINITY_DN17247_c0_g1_i2:734-1261(-)
MASRCQLSLSHMSHVSSIREITQGSLLSSNLSSKTSHSSSMGPLMSPFAWKRRSQRQPLTRLRLFSKADGNFPEESNSPSSTASTSKERKVDAPQKREEERLQPVRRPRQQPEMPAEQQRGLSKLLEDAAAFVTPREKGDIRDVVLCSLTFAVLVYISQRLVTAYAYALYLTKSF